MCQHPSLTNSALSTLKRPPHTTAPLTNHNTNTRARYVGEHRVSTINIFSISKSYRDYNKMAMPHLTRKTSIIRWRRPHIRRYHFPCHYNPTIPLPTMNLAHEPVHTFEHRAHTAPCMIPGPISSKRRIGELTSQHFIPTSTPTKGPACNSSSQCRSVTRLTDIPTTRAAARSGGLRGRARDDAGWLTYQHMEN